MADMDGKVAVVTGGASGIGRAVAVRFAERGARVIVADLAESDETLQAIRDAGSEGQFVRTDVSRVDDIQRMVATAVDAYGRLDFAVNNAGIGGPAAPVAEYPDDGWNQVIAINLTGVFLCMKYEMQQMLAQGSGGAIVNMASILGWVGFRSSSAYVAAKHGVIGLTKAAALDHAAQGIRVNAVCPAFIRTPLIDRMGEEGLNMLVGLHPVGHLGMPEDVAGLTVFLCSDEAKFIHGAPFLVDGGYVSA